MITLTAESHLPHVKLRRENRADLVFQGVLLSTRAVERCTGRSIRRETFSLFKTRTGKYVLAMVSTQHLVSNSEITTANALCFSQVSDVKEYLLSEHPGLGAMIEELVFEAETCDWPPRTWATLDKPGFKTNNFH